MSYQPGRVDQTSVPGALRGLLNRTRILEAVVAGGTVTWSDVGLTCTGGVAVTKGYRWGLAQGGIGTASSNLVHSGAVIGQYQDGASDDSTGTAWLQGGLDGPKPSQITGNLFATVVAPSLLASTALQVFPTWISDANGTGPYLIVGQLIGRACIQQLSGAGARYWCDLVMTVDYAATLIYDGDGSTVTKTNPITLAANDIITGYWVAFTEGWD
jgi:hypothetical protein